MNKKQLKDLEILKENILNYNLGNFKELLGNQKEYFLKFAKTVNLEVKIIWESDCDFVEISYKDVKIIDDYKSNAGYKFLEDIISASDVIDFIDIIFDIVDNLILKGDI